MYVRKEAVLSSQIEGTQSTLTELLEYENAEASGTPVDDVCDVSRYVAALRFAVGQINGGIPLSLRLIRETLKVLMTDGRGGRQDPGEFRRSQTGLAGRGRLPRASFHRPSKSWRAFSVSSNTSLSTEPQRRS
jgi:Fic family protein